MSDHDHIFEPHTRTLHTRRDFLRTSMLGAAVSWTLPVFLQKTFFTMDAMAADAAIQTATGKDHPILVVLQMAGGNDGLNTVIPYSDAAYYSARPVIGIKPDSVLKLNDHIGLNPNLAGLRSLYDQGHLAVIQGVGYPNPNRSHFRSTEIWQTASDAAHNEPYGWLGRYFDSCCKGEDPTVGVAIGNQVPQAFASPNPTGVAFSRPDQYRWVNNERGMEADSSEALYRHLNQPEDGQETTPEMNAGASIGTINGDPAHSGGTLDFVKRTALDAQLSSDKIREVAAKSPASVSYPRSGVADNLSLVARMIAGGLPTRVYYVSQGGYDTHTNQAGTHDRLMKELDEALTAFCKDLQAQGNFNRVMLMTFSEFGRRVTQNANNGTDHGAAAPMFVLGGGVKPGLHGNQPSLSSLNSGDLIYNVDFRSIYATVLEKWMKVPSQKVLAGRFPMLPVV
jgi:uncharacterized protein (DUF1501 family)